MLAPQTFARPFIATGKVPTSAGPDVWLGQTAGEQDGTALGKLPMRTIAFGAVKLVRKIRTALDRHRDRKWLPAALEAAG